MQSPGLFHPLSEITFNPAARPDDPDSLTLARLHELGADIRLAGNNDGELCVLAKGDGMIRA